MSAAVVIDSKMEPPAWAKLQRELLEKQTEACVEFFEHYFDVETGYGKWIPRWGGNDGPDDAAENGLNWTVLYALGAPPVVLDLWKRGYEGHIKQYTEAKTVEVPMARDGMYYRDFSVMFDFFHHTESLSAFTLSGLADPFDDQYAERTKRFAAMYMGEDPEAPNYDKELKLIRSIFTGSRGPMLRKATGLDWAGDPLTYADGTPTDIEEMVREGRGGLALLHGEHSYQQMIEHFEEYNDVAGDSPLNLCATSQTFNAFCLTQDEKYRQHTLEYLDAWIERTEMNGGVVPSNIGLDGTIGGECDGKWWGGVYGWGFSCIDIHDLPTDTPALELEKQGKATRVWRGLGQSYGFVCPGGFANGLLLTGDQKYVDVWRNCLDVVSSNSRIIDGKRMYPYGYSDKGPGIAGGCGNIGTPDWVDFRETPMAIGAAEIYYWSMDPADLERVPSVVTHAGAQHGGSGNTGRAGWLGYVSGELGDDWPVTELEGALTCLAGRVAEMRADPTTPYSRLSDDMNHINPALTETLCQQMLGGLPTGRNGFPLHARFRYFDADLQRTGIPSDCAALVERLTANGATLSLVNLGAEARNIVVQGGAYAEHTIQSFEVEGTGITVDVGGPAFTITIGAGCGCRLQVSMARYSNAPTIAPPWARQAVTTTGMESKL